PRNILLFLGGIKAATKSIMKVSKDLAKSDFLELLFAAPLKRTIRRGFPSDTSPSITITAFSGVAFQLRKQRRKLIRGIVGITASSEIRLSHIQRGDQFVSRA